MSTAREIEEQVRKAVKDATVASGGSKMSCELTKTSEVNPPASGFCWNRVLWALIGIGAVIAVLVWWFWKPSPIYDPNQVAGSGSAPLADIEHRLAVLENNMAKMVTREKKRKHAASGYSP